MSDRTNILLLFCDQLRADALGCYGHPFVRTPVIDELASSGTVFDNAYTPSPVCVPARCSLIMGQEPQNTGCFDNGFEMPTDRPTLMSSLAGAGYRTHGVGKMHFTPDLFDLKGFDDRDIGEEFSSAEDDHYLQFLIDNDFGHVEKPHGLRSEMYYVPQLAQVPEPLHFSHWVADRSIEFINDRPKDRPFFLWSSFIHPHPPFAPPSPWHRLYPPMLMQDPHRPEGEIGLLTSHNRQQNRYKFRDTGGDRRLLQLIRAYYLASVSYIDAQVGRILDALKTSGELDNTLVVFSSDHGEFLGDYGCFGKRSFLDAAARVPLICAGPGFARARSQELVSLMDLMPTFLESAEVPRDNISMDGLPLQSSGKRNTLYGQFQTGSVGLYQVLTPDWKYIYSAADRREYLVDRHYDPSESRNVAYNAYHRDTLLEARGLAKAHFRDLADIDFDTVTYNTPLSLGGSLERDAFRSLSIDDDAGGLVLPEFWSSSDDDLFEEYRAERHRQEETGCKE